MYQIWKGVEEFINFVIKYADNSNCINCSCIKYDCLDKVTVEILRDHLFINKFDISYTRWIWYSESARENRPINSSDRICDEREEVDCDKGDKLEDMMYDVNEYFVDHPHLFESLRNDAEKPLYVGCKFTRLSAVLRLYNLKAGNEWSDKSFTSLLKLLKDMLAEDNELSDRT